MSEPARQFLIAMAAVGGVQDPPALDDFEGWQQLVAATDQMIAARFSGQEFPVQVEEVDVDTVKVFAIRPLDVEAPSVAPVFLDFHGGAFIYGGGDLCRVMCSGPAATRGLVTWAVDYRMPPVHPYPAALDDGLAVYRALLERRRPGDIFVGGGSAGANLAAALMLRVREERLPMPAALVLMTPGVDLTDSGDTFATLLGVDPVLSPLEKVHLLYAGGHDLSDPHLSPLFADLADLADFPPTFLQSGTRDLLLSNTVRMHRKLRAAGVEAELHIWEAMPHGGFAGAPEDDEVQMEVRRFLDRHRDR